MDEPVPPFVPAKYNKGGRNPGPRTPRPTTPPPPSGLPSWIRLDQPDPRPGAQSREMPKP